MVVLFVLASVVLQTLIWLPQYDSLAEFSYQYGTLLALIPIMLYNREQGSGRYSKVKRWFFYVYYPAHMAMIILISHI